MLDQVLEERVHLERSWSTNWTKKQYIHGWFYTGAERVNELWINSRSPLQTFILLMSFEYIYIPQKLRIQVPNRRIVLCSNEHLKRGSQNNVPSKGRTICHFKSFSLYLFQRHSVVLEASRLQKYQFRLILFYWAEKAIIVRSIAFVATVCIW
mgnify:CR=1 FL=1